MLIIGEFVYNISTIAPIGIILLGDCLNRLSLLLYMWVSRVIGNRVMLTDNMKCNMLNVRLMRIVDQIVEHVKLTSRHYY